MVFSSLTFLLVFLPLLVLCYFLVPARFLAARRYILLVFSLVFYACGEPVFIFVLLACVAVTWLLSSGIEQGNPISFGVAMAVNLIPLIVFKYLDFIILNLNMIPSVQLPSLDLELPIGISFYTFQMLTYVIDLRKRTVRRQRNVAYLALYIFMFPQLIAGPIVRYADIEKAIETSYESWDNIKYGTGRFVKGLVKKVVIANQVGLISQAVLELDLSGISVPMMWLATLAYTMQIYFDFSGYSDMAIGLGKIFGFDFCENFRLPYASTSVSEFWRRWHISMSSFFRDYIYIPLGGNRCSTMRWLLNIFVVWTATGIWHGAAWNFIIWGLYYAVLLVLEKLFLGKWLKQAPRAVAYGYTMLMVMVGWAIFMYDCNDIGAVFAFVGKLFGFGEVSNAATVQSLALQSSIPYLVAAILLSTPTRNALASLEQKVSSIRWPWLGAVLGWVNDFGYIAAILVAVVYIIGGSYNPFIYFRF